MSKNEIIAKFMCILLDDSWRIGKEFYLDEARELSKMLKNPKHAQTYILSRLRP